jgi:hypothetical protein
MEKHKAIVLDVLRQCLEYFDAHGQEQLANEVLSVIEILEGVEDTDPLIDGPYSSDQIAEMFSSKTIEI